MKSESKDPRAIRTRQSLRKGLMQTTIEKPFRDITVNDITERAGVNRATFYLHYADKYDLLEDCAYHLLYQIREEIEAKILFDPQDPQNMAETIHNQRMQIVLSHILKHKDFYLAIMSKHGDPLFYNLFRDGASAWIQETIRATLETQSKTIDEEYIAMLVRFQSAGNFDVIAWWLEHNTHVPIDVMAERLARITLPPLIRLIQDAMES